MTVAARGLYERDLAGGEGFLGKKVKTAHAGGEAWGKEGEAVGLNRTGGIIGNGRVTGQGVKS